MSDYEYITPNGGVMDVKLFDAKVLLFMTMQKYKKIIIKQCHYIL